MFLLRIGEHKNLQKDGWRSAEILWGTRRVRVIYDPSRLAGLSTNEQIVLCQKDAAGNADGNIPFLTIRPDRSGNRIMIQREVPYSGHIYYSFNRQDFVLASDIWLMADAGIALKEDTAAFAEQFIFKFILPPRTGFQNICKMFRAENISFSLGAEGFFDFQTSIPCDKAEARPMSKEEAVSQIKNLLASSLELFRPYSEHSALFLSGGMDSTVLYRMISSTIGPVKTYSTSYPVIDERGDREKEYAQSAALWLKADHTHYVPTLEDYLLGLVDAIYENQLPVQMLQSVLVYLLAKNVLRPSEHIVFTGQGFDTLFGSELETRLLFQESLTYRLMRSEPVFQLIRITSRLLKREYLLEQLSEPLSVGDDYRTNPHHAIWLVDLQSNSQWVKKRFQGDFGEAKNAFIDRLQGSPIFQKIFFYSFFGESAHTQNEWAHLIWPQRKALYCPVKSRRMREFSLTIPPALKYKEKKYLVRELAAELGILPTLIQRRKNSFGLQPSVWAVKGGIFEVYLPLCRDYFDQRDIAALQSTDKAMAFTLWNVINYSIWRKLFIEKVPPQTIKEVVRHEWERLSAKGERV